MSEEPRNAGDTGAVPDPEIDRPRRLRISLVWLVPLVAVLVGLGLVVRSVLLAGPMITIRFENAQGLQAGQTEVKYKNVVVGKVRDIRLDKDFKNVLVKVELDRADTAMAVEDTRFWVVRPRVDWGGVSGLNTLISGAYIGVDVGTSKVRKSDFRGLNQPPAITHQQQGRRVVLHATDVGSLNVGAPVYYRRLSVGRVASMQLDPDGKAVTVDLFIKSPYDRFITPKTRFWNSSGVNLALSAGGLKLDAQSLLTVLAGGVAFGTPPRDRDGMAAAEPVAADATFKLYPSRSQAMAPADGPPHYLIMKFRHSVRGLKVGAAVDFRGVDFGHVVSIEMHYAPHDARFWTRVEAEVFPQRLGPAFATMKKADQASGVGNQRLIAALVKKGMRAQLRTGNLISGQLYVALDFFPNSKPVDFDLAAHPPIIPTVSGSLEQVQAQIVDIVHKLDAIPYAQLGRDLHQTLRHTNRLLTQLNGQLAPQARATLRQAEQTLSAADRQLVSDDAPLQRNARSTMEQIQRAARALRDLADYLQRHPEALIRGKRADAPPAVPTGGGS